MTIDIKRLLIDEKTSLVSFQLWIFCGWMDRGITEQAADHNLIWYSAAEGTDWNIRQILV